MKEKKYNTKRIKGITLIALVVTIVVLLILASISITVVLGDNGLLEQARLAGLETRGATVEEQRDSWELSKKLSEQTGNGTAKTLAQLLDELEANKLITKEEKTKIQEDGEVTIGSRTIEFKDDEVTDPISIEEVKAGDWIVYPSAKGDITCRVLYDTAYNTKNGTDYGIQIVSANSVELVKMGTDNFYTSEQDKLLDLYDIKILNEVSEKYINPLYTNDLGARCVGTTQERKYNFISSGWDSWTEDGGNIYIEADYSIVEDYTQLIEIGALTASNNDISDYYYMRIF